MGSEERGRERERGLWGWGGIPQPGLKRLENLKYIPSSFLWSLLYLQSSEEQGSLLVGAP